MLVPTLKRARPLIIAHRGGRYWTSRRPNDFGYIAESIRSGADMIELDVRVRGGHYIVQHDRLISLFREPSPKG